MPSARLRDTVVWALVAPLSLLGTTVAGLYLFQITAGATLTTYAANAVGAGLGGALIARGIVHRPIRVAIAAAVAARLTLALFNFAWAHGHAVWLPAEPGPDWLRVLLTLTVALGSAAAGAGLGARLQVGRNSGAVYWLVLSAATMVGAVAFCLGVLFMTWGEDGNAALLSYLSVPAVAGMIQILAPRYMIGVCAGGSVMLVPVLVELAIRQGKDVGLAVTGGALFGGMLFVVASIGAALAWRFFRRGEQSDSAGSELPFAHTRR